MSRPWTAPPLPERVATGLRLPEAPRWHEGAFWYSDIWGHKVYRLGADRQPRVVAECEMPSGLGWLPDGSMLIVAMKAQVLLRLEAGRLTPYADLSGLAQHWCNDLIVDSGGICYVGCTGGEPSEGPVSPAPLIGITSDGKPFVAASDLHFANGMALADAGRTMFVAETGAGRVTRFSIGSDGRLHSRRLHARLKGRWPDGIDIDDAGRLWVADPRRGSLLRLSTEGDVEHVIDLEHGIAIACALGGPAKSQLLVCAADRLPFGHMAGMNGWLELHRLDDASP